MSDVLEQPLTSSEAVLWMIERDPVLRSTIMAIAVLDGPPDAGRLRRRLDLAVEAFPRLRQRIAPAGLGVPHWVPVPDLDLDHHLTRVKLPAPGSVRQLLDLAGEQAGEAFDPARPLWRLTVVDGLAGGGAALVVKLHHAVTDGVGGVGLLPIFTDVEPSPATEPRLANRNGQRRSPGRNALAAASSSLVDAATDPVAALSLAPRVAASTAKLLAPATRGSEVMVERGLDRHLDTLDVALEDLARAGHTVGGTVNDAFMAAVVGGLRRYHALHGSQASELRVTMPINYRSDGDAPGGNRFTPARFSVPVSIDDPAARMEALGQLTRSWRHEPALGLTDVLAGVLSHLPDTVTTSLFGSMLKGIDFVATNVPGSTERRWLAGAEVTRFYGFGPTSGSAVSFSLMSHLDACCIGVNADTAAIRDPEVLLDCLEQGFAEVVEVGRHAGPRPASPPAASPPASVPATPATPATNHRGGRAATARLSALDASFLEAEAPTTPLHVGALLMLDGGPLTDKRGRLRFAKIRSDLAGRLPRCPRMTQRVIPVPFGAGRPVWEDDPTFDVTNHVHHIELAPPGSREQLDELASQLQMQVLDRSRPLWEMWFVSGLADGSVGLVYKVHHAVVDGVSAAETFEILLAPDEPSGAVPEGETAPQPELARFTDAITDGLRSAGQWAAGGLGLLVRPREGLARAVGVAHLLRPGALAPPSSLNRAVGAERRLVPISLSLDEVKAIGRAHGATVNDVVLTIVAAGLGDLLAARDEDADHLQVLVPVSLRRPDQHGAMGNVVAALMLRLPVGEPDPVAELKAVVAETSRLKAGPGVVGLDFLLRFGNTWPTPLLAATSRLVVHRQPFVNLVVTNVRGAEQPLRLLGAEVTEIVPVVPLGGNLTVGVAVLSYVGDLVLGVHADPEACPDLTVMTGGIEAAFAQLLSRSS